MEVRATAKYLRRSTRKTRLVTQVIVGKGVEEAAAILKYAPGGSQGCREGPQERHSER